MAVRRSIFPTRDEHTLKLLRDGLTVTGKYILVATAAATRPSTMLSPQVDRATPREDDHQRSSVEDTRT